MESCRRKRYIGGMTSSVHSYGTTKALKAKSGRVLAIKGAGALKGRMIIEGVDLTKPIFEQVLAPGLDDREATSGDAASKS